MGRALNSNGCVRIRKTTGLLSSPLVLIFLSLSLSFSACFFFFHVRFVFRFYVVLHMLVVLSFLYRVTRKREISLEARFVARCRDVWRMVWREDIPLLELIKNTCNPVTKLPFFSVSSSTRSFFPTFLPFFSSFSFRSLSLSPTIDPHASNWNRFVKMSAVASQWRATRIHVRVCVCVCVLFLSDGNRWRLTIVNFMRDLCSAVAAPH